MKFLKCFLKTIFNIIIVLLVLLVIVVGYNFIQINVLNKQYASFFGYTFFEITTGSMEPTIEISDVIIVKITKDVKINDIISFIENDEVITHRIISERDNQLITKGDANTGEDKPVEKKNVIGKVVKIIPKFGIWVKVFTDIKVTASIIITLVLFGFAFSSNKSEVPKEETSFSRFMRNRREKRNGKVKKKKKS